MSPVTAPAESRPPQALGPRAGGMNGAGGRRPSPESRRDFAMSNAEPKLIGCLCTQERLESPAFRRWAERLGVPAGTLHRKHWEWCYIAQALHERGLLAPGRRGLGFGVGTEPLAALFASYGCEIVATDLDLDRAKAIGWTDTNEHAASLEALNAQGLCPRADFERLASFRVVDMNDIPDDLTGFDFTWSSCSFEHLGSIRKGQAFIENQMACLRPGGVAVHTTEFNVSSNDATLDDFGTVLFRHRDIEWLADRLRAAGHAIELDYDTGSGVADGFVDVPPYGQHPHLKLKILDYVSTSIGLIVEKRPSLLGRLVRSIRRVA